MKDWRDFINDVRVVESQLRALIPKVAGVVRVEGLKFIADNFSKQGFQKGNGSVSAWQKRKTPNKKKKQMQDQGRAILTHKGHLRRRWDSDTHTANNLVVFQNNMPYAEVHNEGGKAGRGSGFQMPQRKMIGESPVLDQAIEKKVTNIMDKLFT